MRLDDIRAIVPGMAGPCDVPHPMLGKADDGAIDKAFPNNPSYKLAGGGILATHSDMVRVGVTARFALGPLIEKFTRARSAQIETLAGEVGALRTDVEGLRNELQQQEAQLKRLQDVTDFEGRLKG